MEFKMLKNDLLYALNNVSKAITGKSTNPLLEGLYLGAYKDEVQFRGCDLDIFIQTTVGAEVISEGNFVVNSNLFIDIIKKMPNSLIHFLKEKDILYIKCETIELNIIVMSGKDYPNIPAINDDTKIILSQKMIKEMIKGTSFAVATDDTRAILQGVYMQITDGDLDLVALDGYRLSNRFERNIVQKGIESSFVIDGKNLTEISKLLDLKGDITMGFTKNNIVLEFDNTIIVSRLMEGNYVDYKSLIPNVNDIIIQVDRLKFIESIERASLVSKPEKIGLIKLEVKNNNIIVSSNSTVGKIKEDVEAIVSGGNIVIGFNSKYLIETLKNIDENTIEIKLNSPVKPCFLEGNGYRYLILPVRLT